jgi:long-chain acyl-CoA synthetase
VVDVETGTHVLPCAAEDGWTEPGEIVVRGPQVMQGYWHDPATTAAQLRDGWLHTGDLGQMHRDGYFRVVDRLKDLIIRSGMKIYPAEVEAVLLEHPAVRDAQVIGVPDDTRGELVKACVVLRPGRHVTAEELRGFCGASLARYKVPAQVEFRATLHRSAVGKPLRRMLRDEPAGPAAERGR